MCMLDGVIKNQVVVGLECPLKQIPIKVIYNNSADEI